MIGPQLQAASNTLDVLVESGDWKRDEKLGQATLQLRSALDAAGQSPELQTAYRQAVDAYALYMRKGQP